MIYLAHAENGKIYYVEAASMTGVSLGVGWKSFASLNDVQAEWPTFTLVEATDDGGR